MYLEVGSKRTFAVALKWPGWARSGKDEGAALETLAQYGPRYRAAVGAVAKGLVLPEDVEDLDVIERLPGTKTTDFGAPDIVSSADEPPPGPAELRRLSRLLEACWDAFDRVVETAGTTPLRSGPRGGGRDLAKIRAHVEEADAAYLAKIGGAGDSSGGIESIRGAFLEGLVRRAKGMVPDRGPRGGLRWPAAFAVRRSAWHALDHAWEIEDRALPAEG